MTVAFSVLNPDSLQTVEAMAFATLFSPAYASICDSNAAVEEEGGDEAEAGLDADAGLCATESWAGIVRMKTRVKWRQFRRIGSSGSGNLPTELTGICGEAIVSRDHKSVKAHAAYFLRRR